MHLIVPFAGVLSEAGRHACQSLALPHLERLLSRMTITTRLGTDALSLSPPHELALAACLGWRADDGCLPFAALWAARDGVPVGDQAWALLSPAHLHVGTEQVSLADPASLKLSDDQSRELFDIVRPLFESEGFVMHWGAALRWYAAHPSLAALPTASLDRVIGRNIDAWLPDAIQARLIRRLQSEVQMLLYTHEVTARAEAAGRLAVNSFWISGCGVAMTEPLEHDAAVDDRLRHSALAEDWAEWAEAWQALDAGPIAALLSAPVGTLLTLAGERSAQRFEKRESPWWQRWQRSWRSTPAHAVLEAL